MNVSQASSAGQVSSRWLLLWCPLRTQVPRRWRSREVPGSRVPTAHPVSARHPSLPLQQNNAKAAAKPNHLLLILFRTVAVKFARQHLGETWCCILAICHSSELLDFGLTHKEQLGQSTSIKRDLDCGHKLAKHQGWTRPTTSQAKQGQLSKGVVV